MEVKDVAECHGLPVTVVLKEACAVVRTPQTRGATNRNRVRRANDRDESATQDEVLYPSHVRGTQPRRSRVESRQVYPGRVVACLPSSGGELAVFMDRLQEIIKHPANADQRRDARIIRDYCEKYRDYLGVRVLNMPDGVKNITVQRTNNACEIGFRNKKHMWRRTLGTKKVGRKLQSANPAEMLVANLSNPIYLDCVCDGDVRRLPELLAQCSADAAMLAEQRRATPDAHMRTTKRNLRAAGVLAEIVGAIGRHAAVLF